MQRPKMPIKERAKIFAPFDALKGFREMLASEEIIKEDRIELSEDQIEYLSHIINSLEIGMMIVPSGSVCTFFESTLSTRL